jgi:hypothetical protein
MLRGQIVDIVVGSVFLFVGFASGSIAVIRRRARVRIFVWLALWSAMYGALRLSQSPAVVMASPRALQSGAPYVNTAIGYLIVVPALLAFRELTLGKPRVIIQVAAWIGLVIGISGILAFVVTGSNFWCHEVFLRAASRQFFKVHPDRVVRAENVSDGFLTRPTDPVRRPPIFKKEPQLIADLTRQHAVQVLEVCAPQRLIISVQPAKRDTQRFGWHHECEQCEHVRQAPAGPGPDQPLEK